MPSGPPLNFPDFTGGLNVLDSPHLLKDNQCREVSNVQGSTAGAIGKRTGLTTFATPAGVLNSLIACEATPVSALVGATGTTLVSVNAAGTVSTIKTGVTAGAHWEGLPAPSKGGQGPLYLMNGVDA